MCITRLGAAHILHTWKVCVMHAYARSNKSFSWRMYVILYCFKDSIFHSKMSSDVSLSPSTYFGYNENKVPRYKHYSYQFFCTIAPPDMTLSSVTFDIFWVCERAYWQSVKCPLLQLLYFNLLLPHCLYDAIVSRSFSHKRWDETRYYCIGWILWDDFDYVFVPINLQIWNQIKVLSESRLFLNVILCLLYVHWQVALVHLWGRGDRIKSNWANAQFL